VSPSIKCVRHFDRSLRRAAAGPSGERFPSEMTLHACKQRQLSRVGPVARPGTCPGLIGTLSRKSGNAIGSATTGNLRGKKQSSRNISRVVRRARRREKWRLEPRRRGWRKSAGGI